MDPGIEALYQGVAAEQALVEQIQANTRQVGFEVVLTPLDLSAWYGAVAWGHRPGGHHVGGARPRPTHPPGGGYCGVSAR